MKAFLGKALMLFGIAILLLIGLSQVDGLVNERMEYREHALAEVSTGLSGSQTLTGPMVMLPWSERWEDDKKDEKGKVIGREAQRENREIWLLPESLEVQSRLNPDFRQRGIFKIAGYGAQVTMKGHFVLPSAPPGAENKGGVVTIGTLAKAMIGLQDPRGIRSLKMSLNGKAMNFEPGTPIRGQNGAQASLDMPAFNGGRLDFEMQLDLSGADALSLIPMGKETLTTMTSPWPHPSFYGSFLPTQREVTKDGFTATWKVSNLANGARDHWLKTLNASGGSTDSAELYKQAQSFGVRIIEPVNTYSLTDRAIKYGVLFIGLTLAVFALFELLKQLQVHPVQYLMIGLALLLFFVLLLSLSEQIGFARAYGCASAACVLLIGYYSRYVLRGWQPAAIVTAQLALSFGGLYGLLHSDQNALMIGSIILFALLAAVMIGTRNVNWFEKFTVLGQRSPRM